MNLTGEPIDAWEAYRLGLANRVVPDHELLDTALAWARKLAGQAPLAIEQIKRVSARRATSTRASRPRARPSPTVVRLRGRQGGHLRLPRQAPARRSRASEHHVRPQALGSRSCCGRPSAPSCSRARGSRCRPGSPTSARPAPGLWENVDPMEVAHIDAWRRDPDRFWRFYGERFASLVDKRPNEAHRALVELERRGLVRGVITQNVDRLHRAGRHERLVEVHGSIEWSVCMRCGGRVELEQVVELLAATDGAPECAACVAPLKPAVVLFGELLPEQALAEAHELAREADLIVCVGSSLEVHPVAGLPGLTRSAGGQIALVTQGPTPYDGQAVVKLEGDVVARARGRARGARLTAGCKNPTGELRSPGFGCFWTWRRGGVRVRPGLEGSSDACWSHIAGDGSAARAAARAARATATSSHSA